MFELILNTITAIGFVLILIFAGLGFMFVIKAFKFAGEMALLDWKYQRAKADVANGKYASTELLRQEAEKLNEKK